MGLHCESMKLEQAFDLIEKETVTVDEVAEHLGYTKQNVIKLFKGGKLKGRQLDKHYRITNQSVDAFAKSKIAKVN